MHPNFIVVLESMTKFTNGCKTKENEKPSANESDKIQLVYLLNKTGDVVLVKLTKMNCCPSQGSFEFSCLYCLEWRLNSPTLSL